MRKLDDVRNEWATKREYLAEVREWHAFQREAKQTLAAISAKQSTLRSAEVCVVVFIVALLWQLLCSGSVGVCKILVFRLEVLLRKWKGR